MKAGTQKWALRVLTWKVFAKVMTLNCNGDVYLLSLGQEKAKGLSVVREGALLLDKAWSAKNVIFNAPRK